MSWSQSQWTLGDLVQPGQVASVWQGQPAATNNHSYLYDHFRNLGWTAPLWCLRTIYKWWIYIYIFKLQWQNTRLKHKFSFPPLFWLPSGYLVTWVEPWESFQGCFLTIRLHCCVYVSQSFTSTVHLAPTSLGHIISFGLPPPVSTSLSTPSHIKSDVQLSPLSLPKLNSVMEVEPDILTLIY